MTELRNFRKKFHGVCKYLGSHVNSNICIKSTESNPETETNLLSPVRCREVRKRWGNRRMVKFINAKFQRDITLPPSLRRLLRICSIKRASRQIKPPADAISEKEKVQRSYINHINEGT